MLNKNDPLIAAVQKVMQANQAEREAVALVNEKFGVADRRALPRERQHEWDSAYQSLLKESDDMGPTKKKESAKMYKHKTSGKEMKSVKHPGNDWEVMKEALHPNQQKLDVHEPEKDELTKKDFEKLRAMGEEKKMKGDDPCWDNYEMIGMKKKGGKEVPNCVPVKEEGVPGKAIPGDTVTGSGSVTTVPVPKPKPRPADVGSSQKSIYEMVKSVIKEKKMTSAEKAKEKEMKEKLDPTSMKAKMKERYGKKEGEKIYHAKIRKDAMKAAE